MVPTVHTLQLKVYLFSYLLTYFLIYLQINAFINQGLIKLSKNGSKTFIIFLNESSRMSIKNFYVSKTVRNLPDPELLKGNVHLRAHPPTHTHTKVQQ